MSKTIYSPQPPEIIAALAAAGCGIRITSRRLPPVQAVSRGVEQDGPARPAVPPAPPPALPTVEEVVEQAMEKVVRDFPPLELVLRAVCVATKVSKAALVSERRHKPSVRARHLFYFAARELTPSSLPKIGKICGGRDHSTILHGIRQVVEKREYFEPELSMVMASFQPRDEEPST